jgi:hypothetical protein
VANVEGVKINDLYKQIEAVESIDLNLGTNDGIQNKPKKLKEDLKYATVD